MALEAFLNGCVTVDLEVEADGRIRTLGAIRGDRELRTPENLPSTEALRRLEEFARGGRFVIGHNIVAHDRRFVEMHLGAADLLGLPLVDTLYLAPLAFPQRPYHKLLKDYKLGPERSDPVADCRTTLGLLGDCWGELERRERERPGLVSVYRSCFDDSDAEGGTSARRLGGTAAFLGALGRARTAGGAAIAGLRALRVRARLPRRVGAGTARAAC